MSGNTPIYNVPPTNRFVASKRLRDDQAAPLEPSSKRIYQGVGNAPQTAADNLRETPQSPSNRASSGRRSQLGQDLQASDLEITGIEGVPSQDDEITQPLDGRQQGRPPSSACIEIILDTKYKSPAGVFLHGPGPISRSSGRGAGPRQEEEGNALLYTACDIPVNSDFDEDSYEGVILQLRSQLKFRVLVDIGRPLVPIPRVFAKKEPKFSVLEHCVSESWGFCHPVNNWFPDPDFAVGFRWDGLSDRRTAKLEALVVKDPVLNERPFPFDRATESVFFPFFCAEANTTLTTDDQPGISVALHRNAATMCTAVRALVWLYYCAARESEVNNKVLAFSVSHTHVHVKLHGWYPLFHSDGSFDVHPHLFYSGYLTDQSKGYDRWTAYRFTCGV